MDIPTKAKQGEPCTRCGQCCAHDVCGVMLAVNPDAKPPCPQLGYNRERNEFACRVVQLEQFIELRGNWPITAALGIGEGCDSVDNAMEVS